MERRVEQIAQIAAIALLVLGCLLVLRPFVTSLLGAAIMCFATWPIYKGMERSLRGRRSLAALAMTLLLVLIIVLPLALTAATLADNVATVIAMVREMFESGPPGPPEWVKPLPLIGESLDAAWREISSSQAKLVEALKRVAPTAQRGLLQFGIILGEGVLQLSLATFIGFFFYRDGAALIVYIRAAMRRIAGDMAPRLIVTIGSTMQGVIYGILGTAFAQAALALIGFLIAGVPGAMMLAALTFMLSIVPIGPPLIWGGAAAWLLYSGQVGWAIFMAVWGFFAISSIDNVIKPLIISRGSSLPFLPVFLGALGGLAAFGFIGLFIGPTLLAVAYSLAQEWTREPGELTTEDGC